MSNRPTLAFDLNGTLTNLSQLNPLFRESFGFAHIRRERFEEAVKLALAITAAAQYRDFSDILKAALHVVEQRHGTELSPARRKEILLAMRNLPAFADVRPALERLRSRGFRLIVLTNSGPKAAADGVKAAGLAPLFDSIFSADFARRLKPAPTPYRMAARKCGVKRRDLLLVAAHSWDIAGALHAGCRAAFVARPGEVLDPLTPAPDFVVEDFRQLADKLTK